MVLAKMARIGLKPSEVIVSIVGLSSFAYLGHLMDVSETERMTRYRDRSALYGRPPPPPGVKEIPSW